MTPLITNDAIVLGILMAVLAFVFITAHSDVPFWKKVLHLHPCIIVVLLRTFDFQHDWSLLRRRLKALHGSALVVRVAGPTNNGLFQ